MACANCKIYPERVKFCSACKNIAYCSRTCQKADWRRHKKQGCNATHQGNEIQTVWNSEKDPLYQEIKDVRKQLSVLQGTYKQNLYLSIFITRLDKILDKDKPITMHQIEELKQWRQTYSHEDKNALLWEASYARVIEALMLVKLKIMESSSILVFEHGNPYKDLTTFRLFLKDNALTPNEAFVCSRECESPPQSLLIMLTRNRKLFMGDEYMLRWVYGKIKVAYFQIDDFLIRDKGKAALENAFLGIYSNHPTILIDKDNGQHIMKSFQIHAP